MRRDAAWVLMDVAFAGDRLVAVGEGGIVLYSDDGGDSREQADVPVGVTLTAVTFSSPRMGWAVGHGGVTWQCIMDRVENPIGMHLYSIHVFEGTMYIAGEQGLFLVSRNGGGTPFDRWKPLISVRFSMYSRFRREKSFLRAGGAGFEAAINIVVEKTNRRILFWIYGVVILN